MTIWLFGAVTGFIIGYVVFERPQWATDLIARLRAKAGI